MKWIMMNSGMASAAGLQKWLWPSWLAWPSNVNLQPDSVVSALKKETIDFSLRLYLSWIAVYNLSKLIVNSRSFTSGSSPRSFGRQISHQLFWNIFPGPTCCSRWLSGRELELVVDGLDYCCSWTFWDQTWHVWLDCKEFKHIMANLQRPESRLSARPLSTFIEPTNAHWRPNWLDMPIVVFVAIIDFGMIINQPIISESWLVAT